MLKELPDFDYLKALAQDNPEALEALRRELCQRLIDRAPARLRQRLYGLMFRIDMETRRSKNAIHSCVTLSRMMMDSFANLHDALQNIEKPNPSDVAGQTRSRADIIAFPRKSIRH
ncbi:MAG: DUF3135 domain-containing protein [Gammaproteobacteria bacterium]|nr:MAG: DUF3135 domain-containing protein [Gammaproteobacteria bacterium]